MSLLAAIRPDSWNFPLFLHVLGATVLVGGLFAGGATLAFARGQERYLRLGYWTLLALALPGYVVMRIGAEWIYSREGWADAADEPGWLGIGYITADAGGLLLLVTIVLAGLNVRSLRKAEGTGGGGLGKAATVIATLVLLAYIVAVWAMAGKPD
jgi:hypothetical protein